MSTNRHRMSSNPALENHLDPLGVVNMPSQPRNVDAAPIVKHSAKLLRPRKRTW